MTQRCNLLQTYISSPYTETKKTICKLLCMLHVLSHRLIASINKEGWWLWWGWGGWRGNGKGEQEGSQCRKHIKMKWKKFNSVWNWKTIWDCNHMYTNKQVSLEQTTPNNIQLMKNGILDKICNIQHEIQCGQNSQLLCWNEWLLLSPCPIIGSEIILLSKKKITRHQVHISLDIPETSLSMPISMNAKKKGIHMYIYCKCISNKWLPWTNLKKVVHGS